MEVQCSCEPMYRLRFFICPLGVGVDLEVLGLVLQWWEQTQVYLIELNLVAWPST